MYSQRSLRRILGGALVASVALVALGLQDATPTPLSVLFDTPTRAVADKAALEQQQKHQQQAAAAAPTTTAPAPSSAQPTPAPAVDPATAPSPEAAAPAPLGPQPPPLPTMPTGPVITVKKSGGDYSSISAAAAKAKPGDTVLISAGTYAETLDPPTSGTADKPITFQAVPGQKVVIDGGGSRESGNGLVSFSNLSNITMIGITVANSGSHGIYSQGAKNIVLRDCTVTHSLDGGVVFLQSSNVKVQRCDINDNNARGTSASNEAVSLDHTDGFEVSFSRVHDNGEEGIDAKYDSSAGKIFNNVVDANRGPNIYVDSADGVEVFNNVVTGTTEESKAGISVAVESLSDTKKASNVSIYNNVVKGNAGGGIGFWLESGGTFSNITIMNNTVVGNDKAGLNIDSGSFSGTNILRNNIFTGNSGGASNGAGDFTADHNIFDKGGIGSLVSGALTFVSGSLQLTPSSAGVGEGSADGAPDFDLNGVARRGKVDIGAYQLGPIPVPVDVPAVAGQVAGQLNNALGSIASTVTTAVLGSARRGPSQIPGLPAAGN